MTKPTQRPRNSFRHESFTVAHIESMLGKAGVLGPWTYPERLPALADTFASLAVISAGFPDDDGLIGRIKRAQAAVDALRRELPHLIGASVCVALMPDPPCLLGSAEARQGDAARRAIELQKLEAALVNVDPGWKRLEAAATHWHVAAIVLLSGLRSVVGKASGSRNGPGARFVRLALEAVGHGKHELSAIEAAIYKMQRTGRWKSDGSGQPI